MRKQPIGNNRYVKDGLFRLTVLCGFLAFFILTCNGDGSPTIPGPPDYDPFRPTIESFTAQRNGEVLEDSIVHSGEDITVVVQASSHAFPQSCGLDEGETVEGNLHYTFTSFPPVSSPAPGLISQESPPDNEAVWRIPNLDAYDLGEGLLYKIQVDVLDECLDLVTTGNLSLRAFANEGPPVITDILVRGDINSSSPVTELLDQNGFYEVERADECRIDITAESRTSSQVCDNRGVPDGEELRYEWSSPWPDINLSYDQDPTRADSVDFDIPVTIDWGETFDIICRVVDRCTLTSTSQIFRFVAVGQPRITSLTGTANWESLVYDPFFDTYKVQPTDEIILTARGIIRDDNLCNAKGISPDLEWLWEELTPSLPVIEPEFDPLPILNDTSVIQFIVPAAANGTQYEFRCTVTDRCNGLTDTETADFLVIIPPVAGLTSVQASSVLIEPATDSGKYEVQPGALMEIRVTGSAYSQTEFCEARGISASPPVQYFWENPWDLLVLNYDSFPSVGYCDLLFVVPWDTPPIDVNLHCRVKDLCNGLVTQVVVPFRVL